jgi:putative addiction module component (TIGR02574 family)
MAHPADTLAAKALKLPPEERARLAEQLISSLEQETDADAEALWLHEAERRLAELDSGASAGRPAEQVIQKARSALR